MHDGTDDPIWEEPDYEPDPEEKAYELWYEANHTSRSHNWKIRREGSRELLRSKGWGMRGAYAANRLPATKESLPGRGVTVVLTSFLSGSGCGTPLGAQTMKNGEGGS